MLRVAGRRLSSALACRPAAAAAAGTRGPLAGCLRGHDDDDTRDRGARFAIDTPFFTAAKEKDGVLVYLPATVASMKSPIAIIFNLSMMPSVGPIIAGFPWLEGLISCTAHISQIKNISGGNLSDQILARKHTGADGKIVNKGVEAVLILDTEFYSSKRLPRGFKGKPEWFGELGEDNLPTWVDWTLRGAVTPVQNQKKPGACWAFSTVAGIEAANFLYEGRLVKLSEQQLIDCNNVNNFGMEDGLPYEALQYVIANGGLATAEEYPYVAKQQICQPFSTELVTISGIQVVTPGCELSLKAALCKTPVICGMEYSQGLFHYSGGVLRGRNSTIYDLNHSVLAVGYNCLADKPYLKLKDSDGEEKGPHGGYVHLAFNVYETGGTLGIARYCMYPTKRRANTHGMVKSETQMGVKKAWRRSTHDFEDY